jgi:hypothetical protein
LGGGNDRRPRWAGTVGDSSGTPADGSKSCGRLEGFEKTVHPTYIRGSYEEAASSRLLALKSLTTDAAADVTEWAGRQVERVEELAAFWQRLDRDRDQSFE